MGLPAWAFLACVAGAQPVARVLNRSHHFGDHPTYREQRERVAAAVGDYRFYIYEGGAFDAMTGDLLRRAGPRADARYVLAEDKAELWTHRALAADARRTRDPAAASVFFVPAYLTLSKLVDRRGHGARLAALIAALEAAPAFVKNGGRDHVFGYSSTNPGVARDVGFPELRRAMNASWFGTFEMNPAWVGAAHPTPRERASGAPTVLDRMVPMPYVRRSL